MWNFNEKLSQNGIKVVLGSYPYSSFVQLGMQRSEEFVIKNSDLTDMHTATHIYI